MRKEKADNERQHFAAQEIARSANGKKNDENSSVNVDKERTDNKEGNRNAIKALRDAQQEIAIVAAREGNAQSNENKLQSGDSKKSKIKKQKKKKKQRKFKKTNNKADNQLTLDIIGDVLIDHDVHDDVPNKLRGKTVSLHWVHAIVQAQEGLTALQVELVMEAALGNFNMRLSKAGPSKSELMSTSAGFHVFKLAMQMVAFLQSGASIDAHMILTVHFFLIMIKIKYVVGRNLEIHRNPDGYFTSECFLYTEMQSIRLPLLI